MTLLDYLENKNIMTRETLKIFTATLFFYVLFWIFFKYHLGWLTTGSLFISLGGLMNLYVIDFNNFCMPVLVRNRQDFKKMKISNPSRRICMLNTKTRLGLLADRFCVGKSIYSIGDFMAFLGIAWVILSFLHLYQ